ncbi:MAG: lysophospholipid acyltransferase family protein, partial [Rhodospirillaceae bacterium]
LNYRIEGQLNLPKGPILLASKHQSAWDTIIMPLIMPGAAVVLKKELTYIPFYGWYLKKYGVIAIERGRKLVAIRKMRSEAKRCLTEGRSIVIFPEGTRVQPQSAKKFQTGVAALYQDLEIPVVPVALNSGCFWSRRSFVRKPGTITLRFLSPIRPGLDKKTFLKTLEEGISNAQKTLDPAG